MADPTRISEGSQGRRRQATGRRTGRRLARGLRTTGPAPACRRGVPAGPAVHGLRNPVLPLRNRGLPAGQPDPGVERPGATGPLGCGQRPPARDQQFPGVHRPAVSRAVRGRVRAVDRRGADRRQRHDQAHRADHRRPGLDGRHRRTATRGHRHRAGGWPSSDPDLPDWLRRNNSPARATTSPSTSATTGSAG